MKLIKFKKHGEKLYNKNAKLEYNRHIVFSNIEEKSDEIKRCLEKIEKDIEKNKEAFKELDENFWVTSDDYKEKKSILLECKNKNKEAKTNYENVLENTKNICEAISNENLEFAREFVSSDNKDKKKELNNLLNQNGINEKNPFDVDVTTNAVNISFEIYKKELQIYIDAYDKTNKILNEIQENDVKIDKHTKFLNDSKAKLDFLFAEKYYIVGFLDNERITAIYDKKLHRKLMLEACRNFNSDLEHINNLYEIILKEVISRSSKRLYKDNYDRNYLTNIEKDSEKVQEETSKLKSNTVAVMNLNYWRIDGISKIQEVFETDVKEIYGKNVDEIIPKEQIEEIKADDSIEEFSVENILEKTEIKKKRTIKNIARKTYIKDLLNNDEKTADLNKIQETLDSIPEENEGLGEVKSNNNANKENNDKLYEEHIDVEDENIQEESLSDDSDEIDNTTSNLFDKISKLDELDEDDALPEDYQEESILDFYFKNSKKDETKYDKVNLNKKDKKDGIFKKLIGINSKNKQEA